MPAAVPAGGLRIGPQKPSACCPPHPLDQGELSFTCFQPFTQKKSQNLLPSRLILLPPWNIQELGKSWVLLTYLTHSAQISIFAFLCQNTAAGSAIKGVILPHLIANQVAVCIINA